MYSFVKFLRITALLSVVGLLGETDTLKAQDIQGGVGILKPNTPKPARSSKTSSRRNRRRMSISKNAATVVVNGIGGRIVATNFAGDRIEILGFDPPINASSRPIRRISQLSINMAYRLESANKAKIEVDLFFKGKSSYFYIKEDIEGNVPHLISKGAGNTIYGPPIGDEAIPVDQIVISLTRVCQDEKGCKPTVILTLKLNLVAKQR